MILCYKIKSTLFKCMNPFDSNMKFIATCFGYHDSGIKSNNSFFACFFLAFGFYFFGSFVAVFDLVHDLETIFHLRSLLT